MWLLRPRGNEGLRENLVGRPFRVNKYFQKSYSSEAGVAAADDVCHSYAEHGLCQQDVEKDQAPSHSETPYRTIVTATPKLMSAI